MESWRYVSQGKGFLSDETISPPSTLARSKCAFSGWEFRTCSDFGNHMLFPTPQKLENQGFRELSFPEMVGKQSPTNHPASDVSNNKLSDAHGRKLISSVMAAPNGFSNGEDSNSKRSNSVVESNGRDSLIDLKLGRFGDQRDGKDLKFSEVAPPPILWSSSSSAPPKRARASGGHSQTAFCQVYGCNKDLSRSKDYHKRNKVCELHSKTTKVIVNGIEQRFCQQCSRFHLLAEFDDGKRSCRKRLAGHNERRRKPQVVVHAGRPGRLTQSNTDNKFQGTSFSTASFICQDILPSRLLHGEKLAANNWFRPIKTEDGANYSNLSAIPVSNGQPNSRSFVPLNSAKPFYFLQENDDSTTSGNIFTAGNCQYTAALGIPNSGQRSLFHNNWLESEDFNVFDTTSYVQGLSGILDSGCALSLLSTQSQNSSGHSSGIPIAGSFVMQSSQSHYSMNQVSEKVTGMNSQNSTIGVLNKFPSTEMNPADGHLGVGLISDCSDVVNFNISDEILQETDFVNAKDHLICKNGATINLLQLSSQLQRVEHHRQIVHVKPEHMQHKNQ